MDSGFQHDSVTFSHFTFGFSSTPNSTFFRQFTILCIIRCLFLGFEVLGYFALMNQFDRSFYWTFGTGFLVFSRR